MLYAVTAAQMRAMEEKALDNGVSSLLLMERAAQCTLDALEELIGGIRSKRVLFVCGSGNNGGDGLAAARILLRRGGRPIIAMCSAPNTNDARTNAAFLDALGVPVHVVKDPEHLSGNTFDAIVDCIFGTGLSRPPEGLPAAMIAFINAYPAPVLSVDVPSGADASTGHVYEPCVKANATVVLHCHKVGLLTGPARAFAGKITAADIGLPAQHVDAYAALDDWPTVAEASDLAGLLPARALTAHKGDAGRVLILAGSFGMTGAAAIAAQAALTAGAGLVTVAAGEDIIPIIQQLVPNATCMPLGRATQSPPLHDVLLAGCGLSREPLMWDRLMALYTPGKPTVLDADALNLLSEHPGFKLSRDTLITPHPGEAARLLHTDISAVTDDLPGAARALYERYGATMLLKSHASVAFDGERMAINAVAAPSLSKGGSGDMLAGILAGLLAQGKPAPDMLKTAQAASLWMSLAANRAARKLGELSVLSGDVLSSLGPVLVDARRRLPQSGTRLPSPAGS